MYIIIDMKWYIETSKLRMQQSYTFKNMRKKNDAIILLKICMQCYVVQKKKIDLYIGLINVDRIF